MYIMASSPPAKKIKVKQDGPSTSYVQIFSGICAYFVEQGVGKVRCNIFKRQVKNHGGCVREEVTSDTSHVFINKGLKKERLLKILKWNEPQGNVKILFVDWLSASLMKGEIIKEDLYVAYPDAVEDVHVVCKFYFVAITELITINFEYR